MAAITINIPDEQLQKLQEIAEENGISPEELLRSSIENWLHYPQENLEQAKQTKMGVAELRYESQKFYLPNSYSLRLCVSACNKIVLHSATPKNVS
ncbi:ribbon-helix-helix domain-containing protein [Cronbergia sp. UHCC 0137]|uniref:ribbon-helix-helix domain-containing protein n=1 Tax=Cronbergia sp. UHCC 0137 TaxID=3110239 RepID=UPI002B210935|nr:ribbon-helix-helix domain-containing protein [Cronbergia sp. UHCC 0137]MEA5617621.1 ribbon-helix-helix domain-containing protein [Cronbergia sp. UHCC 0137]